MSRFCLLLLGALCAAPALAQSAAPAAGCSGPMASARALYTPEQLADIGRQNWQGYVDRYGLVDHPAWQAAVTEILEALVRAAAHPGLDIRFALVASDDVNAGVLPGDYMVVFSGLLKFYEGLAAERYPNDPERARATFRSLLAGTLAHEVAHLTLGHPGSLVATHLAPSAMQDEGGARLDREYALPLGEIERLGYNRACETEADRTGALYLVRAGFEIQGMIDFFRAANDRMDREAGRAGGGDLSYLSSHPHHAERIADLEIFRAELIRHQRRFDDALTLVRNNVELEHAIELLDAVLVDFPDLLAARQARATALHRLWLNQVPLDEQRVRPSLMTVSANLLPRIRGPRVPTERLEAAAAEYDRILAERALPETLSNRALVHAWLDRPADAERLARRALAERPGDPALANNLGVVLLLAGRAGEALAIFRDAATAPITADNAPAWLNAGLLLLDAGDASAHQFLGEYLRGDGQSAWAQYARDRLRREGAVAPEPTRRDVPAVAGVRLGQDYRAVEALLGEPEDPESFVWTYPAQGVRVGFDQQGQVRGVVTFTPEHAVGAVRIGADGAALQAAWGLPQSREPQGAGALWAFLFGDWMLVAYVEQDVVREMGVVAR